MSLCTSGAAETQAQTDESGSGSGGIGGEGGGEGEVESGCCLHRQSCEWQDLDIQSVRLQCSQRPLQSKLGAHASAWIWLMRTHVAQEVDRCDSICVRDACECFVVIDRN